MQMGSVDCSGSACFSKGLSCARASPGCEFQNTGSGVSLILNAKFAGVGIVTEPFWEEGKNVLKEKYLKV